MHQLRLLLLAAAAWALLSAPSCNRICDPGATQLCWCPGSVESAQVCAADGTSWEGCACEERDEGPDDDDAGTDDDDTTPPPDDDDVGTDDDDVQPDDDDVQPDDDDVQPDDDDSGIVECGELTPCTDDPTICDLPDSCAFDLGCTCVPIEDFAICMPNCNSTDDCPWKDGEQMQCQPEGYCSL